MNPTHSFNKVYGVVAVFLYAGANRKNVGIKDDVTGRNANVLGKNAVAALANFYFALQ